MAFALSDIFIGGFPISQAFGNKLIIDGVDVYAKWGMPGHNGTDIACPSGTQILAGADGWVKKIGYEAAGYGNYIVVVHNGFYTRYAHLNDIVSKVGDHVISGQLIAHSNNSGNSTAAHLHLEVVPCDEAGNPTENNPFQGRIDPLGDRVQWTIKNLTAPVVGPIATESGADQATIDQLRIDRDLNWNMGTSIITHLGIAITPEDRAGMIELAKREIENIREEARYQKEQAEAFERKYEDEKKENIDLNSSLEKLTKSNKDYGVESFEDQQAKKESENVLKKAAETLNVVYNPSDKEGNNLILTAIKEVVEYAKKLETFTTQPVTQDPRTVAPSPLVSVQRSNVFTSIGDVLFGWMFVK